MLLIYQHQTLAFVPATWRAKCLEKTDKIGYVLVGQTQRFDIERYTVTFRILAASIVVLHDLSKCLEHTIVHVRRRQGDVPQSGSLEGFLCMKKWIGTHPEVSHSVDFGTPQVVAEKSGVVEIPIGKIGSTVTRRTTDVVLEKDLHASLGRFGHGGIVTLNEPIIGRRVRD